MKTLIALVCDDDRPIRKMVCDILQNLGVQVFEAQDGQEAIAQFVKNKIDLVVIDFLMPKVDGVQVIRTIRKNPERSKIPIILMSAISKSQIMADQPESGPDYYVNKPFKPQKLSKLLERVVQKLNESP